MTKAETIAWQQMNAYAQNAHGYSIVDMEPNDFAGYTVKLNQLGSAAQPRQITIFADVLQSILASDELPPEVKRNIDEAVQ